MSTYPATEAAVLDLLQTFLGYGSDTSSRGDFRVLDAPASDSALVVIQGGDSDYGENLADDGSHGEDMARHRIAVVVAYKRKQGKDGDTYVALQDATERVVDLINRYPRLNDTDGVKNTEIKRVRPPIIRRDSPHLIQIINLEILTTDEPFLMETPA